MNQQNLQLVARDCPACGAQGSRTRHGFDGWRIVECEACGFVYLPVAAAPDWLVEGDGAWENALESNHRARAADAPVTMRLSMKTRFRTKFRKKNPAQFVERHFAHAPERQIDVLDIGCGSGGYLLSLGARYRPFGIELSKGLAHQAQSLFAPRGGFVIQDTAVGALPRFAESGMDAVVMRSYLEHEPEPKAVLEGCARLLRDDGVIVVKVPNYASWNRSFAGARWCGFRYPEHVNYFTPASLAAMAASVGLKTRQRLTDRLPTGDNMWAALTKA